MSQREWQGANRLTADFKGAHYFCVAARRDLVSIYGGDDHSRLFPRRFSSVFSVEWTLQKPFNDNSKTTGIIASLSRLEIQEIGEKLSENWLRTIKFDKKICFVWNPQKCWFPKLKKLKIHIINACHSHLTRTKHTNFQIIADNIKSIANFLSSFG